MTETPFDLSEYQQSMMMVQKGARTAMKLRAEFESPNHGLPDGVTYTQEQIDARGGTLLTQIEMEHVNLINVFLTIKPKEEVIAYLESLPDE